MNLVLASDFPASAQPAIVERLRAAGTESRVAWIPPDTESGHAHFDVARRQFADLGFDGLEYCDIDRERDDVQLAYLADFAVIYLSGGDPIRFRLNMLRSGLGGRLRQAAEAGCLILAASGGALLLTPNVSVFRLLNEPLEVVLAERARFGAVGAVPYELLPHLNRHEAALLEKVRAYSAQVDVDILGLPDGGGLFHENPHEFEASSQVTRFRRGEAEALDAGVHRLAS